MAQPIQTLIAEHGRIRSMLSCFEAQLNLFERGETPDYEILEGSIAYARSTSTAGIIHAKMRCSICCNAVLR